MSARQAVVLALVLAGIGAGPAVARAASETVRVDYEAPAECPDAASFRAQVLARTDRADLVTVGDTPRSFYVRLVVRGGKAIGRLEVREAGGVATTRALSGDRCDEVVAGLALTGALAIDPNALGPKPPPEPPPLVVSPPRPPRRAPVTAPRTTVTVGMALAPLAAGGVGNDLALGAMLSVDAAIETPGAFTPWVRAWAGHARTDVVSMGGNADFAWTVGALLIAPFRLPRRGAFGLRPYVVSHAGVLDAWGLGVQNARSSTLAWVDAGLGIHAELAVVRHFGLEIDGSAAIPITRVDFVLESPRTPVYEAPWVAWVASFGAHVAF